MARRGHIEWVWHDGVGYCFAAGQEVVVRAAPQDGDWSRIMDHSEALEYQETLPRDILTKPVFSLWIEHGLSLQGGFYQYAIHPGVTWEEMDRLTLGGAGTVEVNTTDLQAFSDLTTGKVLSAFYRPGSALDITVDQPCLVIGNETGKSVTVSNPENEALTLNIKFGSRVALISLPAGPLAGASITQEL